MHRIFAFLTVQILCATSLEAHEFWVEPLSFHLSAGEDVEIDLRVGQMLEGVSYPYLSDKFARFEMIDASGVRDLTGREGDIPAATYSAEANGLHVIAYHAMPERLTYDEFADFAAFIEEEGLADVTRRHRARGLPDAGFSEGYSRNAKALIQVGLPSDGKADRATGMPFELVALENPYLGRDRLPVQLLWQGMPVANAQVTRFHRTASGETTRATFRTDPSGIAAIPFSTEGTYLLSAVHMDERPAESGEVWHSTWASLTFGWAEGKAP